LLPLIVFFERSNFWTFARSETACYLAFTSNPQSELRFLACFWLAPRRITILVGKQGELKGENDGFSTFFSTVVENFGGSPYGTRRGRDFSIGFWR
jgi:hypothetical protein